MYKINPVHYSSVFVVPTEITDKHIRLAGAVQLKALLWLFRHAQENVGADGISSALGIPEADIRDAMQYWIECGIVLTDGENAPVTVKTEQITAAAVKAVPEEKTRTEAPYVKPTHEQIAARISESEDVRGMFYEVQRILGRTVGFDTQSSLLFLMDHEGLPAEVIVMLCEYAKGIGKGASVRYIEKMGIAWAEKEIDTFEKASSEIARMENNNTKWNGLRSLMGLENEKPTQKQSEYIDIWFNTFGFSSELIYAAYERMTEKTGKLNFKYMHTMLKSWHDSGFSTVDDVEKEEAEYREKLQKTDNKTAKSKADPKTAPASYDIDKAFGSGYKIPTKTKKGQ